MRKTDFAPLTRSLLAVGVFMMGTAAGSAPPPIEAFAALPAISDVALSPNGNLLAWADRSKTDAIVVIYDIAAAKPARQIAVGSEYKLRDIGWADDETILVQLSQAQKPTTTDRNRYRLEIFRTLSINVPTGKASLLLMAGGSRSLVNGATLESLRADTPKTVVMSTLDYSATAETAVTDTRFARTRGDSGWIAVLFAVSTDTGKGKLLESGTQFTDQWVVDSAGHCVARSEWDSEHFGYRVLAKNGSGWKEIFSRPQGPTLDLRGVNADGSAIVALGRNDAGKNVIFGLALDGSGTKTLFEDPEFDVMRVITDRYTQTPVAVVLGGIRQEVRWLDAAAKAKTDAVARAFKGKTVWVYGRSQDGKRVLAQVSGPAQPAVYYLVDYNKRTADIVGEEYPGLVDAQLGEVRTIAYKARDGQEIPAYLTLPPGSSGKGLPLVVLPHGGPRAHDSYDFDWWAQLLATRGYAVLQPQFRGSTGFGAAFESAGFRQWGGLMQDDISDGVKAMIAEGVTDAKRVCIVGASYGGYAALAGVAFAPDLYRCAASYAGVSNVPQMLGADRMRLGDDSPTYLELLRTVGSPSDPVLAKKSPVYAADRIVAPVLLIHGLDDTVVPIAQSDAMVRALKELNSNVGYVKLPGEDHWLSRGSTRQQMLAAIDKFLGEHLPR